mgnify:CR=1 FL=1|tara:strand:+ start:1936 stop:2142 length:207 start_codon:yes stop_codon:yes gene_type:complete
MGTVNKRIADDVVAGKYASDRPVKIVKYQNAFNGEDAYGLICAGDPLDKYRESDFVIDPVVYWVKGVA